MGSPRSWSGVIDANDAVDSRRRGKQARAGLRLALASHCRLDLKRIAPPTTQFPSTVALTGSDGSSATALLSSASPNVKLFRVDPNGDWALYLEMSDASALKQQSIYFTLVITKNGVTAGSRMVEYRYDAALFSFPSDRCRPEWNGPGARWLVGSTSTKLNWEVTPLC